MSALAILWKKKGWKVTGSDVGFYPPISTHLQKHGIEYYPGWHAERIGGCHSPDVRRGNPVATADSRFRGNDTMRPDLVVVGNVAGSTNPEWKFVQKNKIPYVSYPELIARNLVKENSIVCAGTYGKTSTAALLTWILKNAGYNPAYMFGGLSLDMEESADENPPSQGGEGGVGRWSVLEGDEYKTSRWDNRAKFFSYKPTHLLLTAVEWDHADVYPTEESYIEAFQKLVEMVPKNGIIVAAENVADDVVLSFLRKQESYNARQDSRFRGNDKTMIIKYGKSDSADYQYTDVVQSKDGLTMKINQRATHCELRTPIIGEYNAANICGAFAMAKEIGIAPAKIIEAIKKFHGLKRRLEKRGQINGAGVFDDIAHSPLKARAVLETLRRLYKKIYAVFEPNAGHRQPATIAQYERAFAAADTVIIPRLTKIKIKLGEKIIDGPELAEIIAQTHSDVRYFEQDEALVAFLKQKTRPGDAVAFLGSHGFRGMIERMTKS